MCRATTRLSGSQSLVAAGRRLSGRSVSDRRPTAERSARVLRRGDRPRRGHSHGRHRGGLHPTRRLRFDQRAGPGVSARPAAAAILAAEDFDPIAVMSNRSEPGHGRIRVHTRQGFSNRRLAALADYMGARASGLLEEMLAAGPPAEYVQAIAFPLPAEIVFRLLGFPPEDDALIKSWCVNRKAFSWGKPTAAEQVAIAQAMLDYWRYCRAFVASRRAAGRRLLLGAARRPRPRPRPGERHRHQLPGGRVGRLRHQLRRPRPRHRAPVQHASMFAAAA